MKRIILIILLVPCSLFLKSQSLTIDQVREAALENNHRVKDASLTTEIAEQAVRQYRANFFPDISLTGFGLYSNSKKTLAEYPLSQYSPVVSGILGTPMQLPDVKIDWEFGFVWHGGVQLKQPLYMGGKITAAHRIAKHSLNMARQNQRLTDTEVIEMADEAYVNVVRASELSVVAKKYNELLAELERNVQSAVDLGMKMPADLLRVQVKKNETELQMRRAENALRLAKMNINYVMGRSLDSAVDVSCDIDTGSSSATATADGIRPEERIMQEKLAIARQQVRVARADAMPNVALMASYGYTNGLKLAGTRLFDGADFLGGVTLSVPIYHFGERSAKIRQAKLRAKQAENDLADLDGKLALARAKAQNEMDEATLELELNTRSLQQAETSMEMTRQQYDAGMTPLSELLDAQALWQQAHETLIESRCNMHTARTALQKAMGTLR